MLTAGAPACGNRPVLKGDPSPKEVAGSFWRARDGVVHCATCEPAHAAWLIAERLRAGAVRPRPVVAWPRLFQSAAKSSASIARGAPSPKRSPGDRGPNTRFGNSLQFARRARAGYDMDYLECFGRKEAPG